MELKTELRQPIRTTIGSLDPSHLWVLGLAIDGDGALVGPGGRQDSYWAECECPDDCLKDHENE